MIWNKRVSTCLATGLALCAPAAAQSDLPEASTEAASQDNSDLAQPVRIRFTGISPEEGTLWISLCTREEVPKISDGGCSFSAQIPAKEGAEHTFDAAPPGTYVVSAYHDDNDNGRLDFDGQGIPFEAIGNSRNAVGEYGPPTFDQTKFDLKPRSQTTQTLAMTIEMRRIEF